MEEQNQTTTISPSNRLYVCIDIKNLMHHKVDALTVGKVYKRVRETNGRYDETSIRVVDNYGASYSFFKERFKPFTIAVTEVNEE